MCDEIQAVAAYIAEKVSECGYDVDPDGLGYRVPGDTFVKPSGVDLDDFRRSVVYLSYFMDRVDITYCGRESIKRNSVYYADPDLVPKIIDWIESHIVNGGS